MKTRKLSLDVEHCMTPSVFVTKMLILKGSYKYLIKLKHIKVTGPPKEPGRNRKPAFQPIQTTLEPYRKKAKITLLTMKSHTFPDQRESLS